MPIPAENIEFAKLFNDCKQKAINSITECYHPKCTSKSINSHILQKNGILSELTDEKRHLWEHAIDQFNEPQFKFKQTGINKVYSFKCFCNEHDTKLFEKIEKKEIDFDDYESCLLFTLRTLYNEIFRKQVNLKQYECSINEKPENFDNPVFHELVRQEKLGLDDLYQDEIDIWNDIEKGTESFVFENREITKLGACLSAFFNYDTSQEMFDYQRKHGQDMDRVSSIFINCFPYRESSMLLMGYNKKDEKKLKGYFYMYFREKEKRVLRYLTNLFLFRCETWVCSDAFYTKNIEGIESLYADATKFSIEDGNERKVYPLNFYQADFKKQFTDWKRTYVG